MTIATDLQLFKARILSLYLEYAKGVVTWSDFDEIKDEETLF